MNGHHRHPDYWSYLLLTWMQCPVIQFASGLAKNTNAGAISAGCAARPCRGVPRPKLAISSADLDDACSAVMTGPGATMLTRMPRGASCRASERVKETIAPFVEA